MPGAERTGSLVKERLFSRCSALWLLLFMQGAASALAVPDLGITVQPASGSVTLEWTAVAGADFYRIHVAENPWEAGSLLTETAGLSHELAPGVSRKFFTVTAVDTTGWRPGSAPLPVHDPSSVLALFSDAYSELPVDTWSADWDQADVTDLLQDGDHLKLYTNLDYCGIEFASQQVDATPFSHFHVDLWTPDNTNLPATFRVKLVDFGADAAYGGGDDSEHEIAIDADSTPPLESESWVSLDLPLIDFTGLQERQHLSQLLFSGDPDSVFVDNIYFWSDGTGEPSGQPLQAPAAPTEDAWNVISLFSSAYGNVPVDTWSAPWDMADLETVTIAGEPMLKYTNLVFAGIECVSQTINLSSMTHLHLDLWTPDPTDLPAVLRVKLVDFGANGIWDGGGDDVEHELSITAASNPPLESGRWMELDLPLDLFTNMTTRQHFAQMILSGDPNTLFVDNVYFYNAEGGSGIGEPPLPAPVPGWPGSSVVSLYSDAYSNHAVDSWAADWGDASVEELAFGIDHLLRYTDFTLTGIDCLNQPVDANEMTHLHMDIWLPDSTLAPWLSIKLVDLGANGLLDGGLDDSEHEILLNDALLQRGQWNSLDLSLSDFPELTSLWQIGRIQLEGAEDRFYLDNLYFYNPCGTRREAALPYTR
jgi:hypothetical protein